MPMNWHTWATWPEKIGEEASVLGACCLCSCAPFLCPPDPSRTSCWSWSRGQRRMDPGTVLRRLRLRLPASCRDCAWGSWDRCTLLEGNVVIKFESNFSRKRASAGSTRNPDTRIAILCLALHTPFKSPIPLVLYRDIDPSGHPLTELYVPLSELHKAHFDAEQPQEIQAVARRVVAQLVLRLAVADRAAGRRLCCDLECII